MNSAIGSFSFSGTAYRDTNENGYDLTDPMVQVGETARIWFGTANYGTDASGWSLRFDNQGWGSRSPNEGGPWAAQPTAGYGSGYEGVLDVQAVPEPIPLVLIALGLGSLAVFRRRIKEVHTT